MTNTIKCTSCGTEIEITTALRHEFEAHVREEERTKYEKELTKAQQVAEEKAVKKARADIDLQLKSLQQEKDEEKKRAKRLEEQLLELTKELRKARQEKDDVKLEMEKQLLKEQDKIRTEARKQTEEEHRLKDLEKDKKLQDALKVNEELKRKLEQGSQQTQGEVLELDLEQLLKEAYPGDKIEPVGKGVRGADIRQTVMSPSGRTVCGIILWESKQTKHFSSDWIGKLKSDMRSEKANLAALVTSILPDDIAAGLGRKDGVWVCERKLILPLAVLLRDALIKVAFQRTANMDRGQKADLIYEYVTSHAFRQQVEAILEAHQEMQLQINKERTAFERSWKQREGQLQRMVLSLANIYGSMQGLAGGSALPQLSGLELEEGNKS